MLIPLGTDRPLARMTLVTFALIGLNVILYIAGAAQIGASDFDPIARALKLVPSQVESKPWMLLSYAFVHADFWHIFGNMAILWVFGPSVEDRFGRIGFLAFYLLAAVASAGAYMAFSNDPVLGASGAIAAVTGAYAVLFPRTSIKCLLFLIYVGVFNIPALWFIGIAVARDIIGIGSGGQVAHQAHLGGYVFGSGIAFVLLATKIIPREPFDMFQLLRQYRRRSELRAAVQEAQQGPRGKVSALKAAGNDAISVPEAALHLRAEVNASIAAGNLPQAAERYNTLGTTFAAHPSVLLLSRQNMMLLGNHFFATADYPRAATIYERFLAGYPSDAELPHVKLMLGLIRARYLGQPAQARALILEAAAGVADEQHAELAKVLLAEIDAGVTA